MSTERVEGTEMKKNYDETRIAEEIVSVLPRGVARALTTDRETIRYSVRADGLKLRTIVFLRDSLRRLIEDPVGAIKVEYLQRDLVRNAGRRGEFRYPHQHLFQSRTKFSAVPCQVSAV
jgi:hypothetical protein